MTKKALDFVANFALSFEQKFNKNKLVKIVKNQWMTRKDFKSKV